MDVEVMQRAAADAAALDHVHLLERAILDDAEAAIIDVPESVARDLARRARKVGCRPTAAALKNAH